ncbi:zinc knuckle CX2CX4HX4C containing protein [Tanacetum coccineum]
MRGDTHDAGNINNVVNNVTTVVPTSDGNGVVSSTAIMTPTPGMSTSYANVTSKPSRNSMSFRTLITPAGNGVNVVVPVESIRAISERFVNTTYGFFLGKRVAYPVVANYVRSSYATTMIELRVDEELKDTSIVAMPKLVGEGFYMFTIRIEYEWKPLRCAYCKVFGHVQNECPKNIGSDVVKNLKNPCQAPRGVPVGPKV